MLQKGVYPYEYIDDWEKFNEASLSEKEDFHKHLDMEHITNADCKDAKRFWNKNIKKKIKIPWFVCSKGYIIVSWCFQER